jgi:hypothetical protein
LENICHAFRLAAALILTPACQAQEVSPDHFTETGIEGISPVASTKAAPSPKQRPSAVQARNHQTDSLATLQLASKRDSSSAAQPGALAIQEKRKPAAAVNPRKPP